MRNARTATPVLELEGICRSYSTGPVTVDVLHRVDLRVDEGEMVAIMGPSGSGKSTLMNIIGLLDCATQGRYLLKGRAIESLADDELAALRNATIGFVFQEFHLLSRLNAWQNVALPLVYRGTERRESRKRAREMLERVGLGDRNAHRPDELSGGQRQRVAIARALVGRPEIVLADEPTGALDSETGQEIMTLLRALNERQGTTTIIITHDQGVAAQCKRQMRLRNGRLRENPRNADAREREP